SSAHCVCARGDRVDRSAGNGRHAGATTFAVGVRHAAMSVEASRHGVQLELSRTRLVQFAQYLVFPNHSRRYYADGGFVPAGVIAIWCLDGSDAVHPDLPRDGRASRHASLHARARANRTRLAHSTNAPDLSADAQLLRLESNPARHQRRLGQLGQTRTHSQCARSSVTTNFPWLGNASVSSVCDVDLSEHGSVRMWFAPATHAQSKKSRHIPAAWRAIVKKRQIAERHVYADNKPIYGCCPDRPNQSLQPSSERRTQRTT